MENYRISSEVIVLPQKEPPGCIANLVSLTNNRIWIYFYSGICQYWDLYDFQSKSSKLLSSMKIPPGIHHSFAISIDKIAFYDHYAQRLKVIRLLENSIDPNFWAMLPTNNTVGNNERNDDKKIEDICRDYTKICAFINSETIVTLEKTLTNSNNSDSVISVFKESNCPEPFKQKIHNSNTSSMATLNTEDTIIIYQLTLEKTHVFFIWNVFSDEKNMRKIVIKNDLVATVIKVTSFSAGKFAVWMNTNQSGSPEVGVVDYETPEKEKKDAESTIDYYMERRPITHYTEDWLLQDVLFYDQKKELVLLAKSGEDPSLELINVKTFCPYFTKSPQNSEEDSIDFTLSPALDMKYFVEYVHELAEDVDDEEEEEIGEKEKDVKIVLNNIVGLRVSLLNVLERKKIIYKYGTFLANEIVDMLTIEGKE